MTKRLCHYSVMLHTILSFPTRRTETRPRSGRFGAAAAAAFAALCSPELARADMLTGGLIGSVLRGDEFTGPRLVDLAVLGLLIFVVLRLAMGRSKAPGPGQTPAPPSRPEPLPPRDIPQDGPRPDDRSSGKPNMYTNAEATWAALKSPTGKSKPTETAPGTTSLSAPPVGASSEEEFLAGAKMAYSRIMASLEAGDAADLAHFVTPELLASLRTGQPVPSDRRADILLIEATLAGQREDAGRTVMDVDFSVLVREPGAPQNTERHSRWRFVRDTATPGANWLLADMKRS